MSTTAGRDAATSASSAPLDTDPGADPGVGRQAPDAVPSWLPVAAVAVTLVLWASAFVGIRHLAGDFSPGALSLGRLVVGAATLGVGALTRGVPRPTRREWLSIVVIGVLWFGAYNVALNEGEHRVDAGTAALLIQVSPVLVALLATLFLGERFTRYLGLGLALAFAGVGLISVSTSEGSNHDLVGVLLCVLAAVAYAISIVLQKPLVARLPAIHVTWLACTVGALVCLPFAGRLIGELGTAPTSSTVTLVYLGVFPTAIAFTTYAFALQHMSASALSITTYLVPPLVIVMGLIFLGEAPPAMAYVGGALALVGVAISRRSPTRRVRPSDRRVRPSDR